MTLAQGESAPTNPALATRFGPVPIDPLRVIDFRYGLFGFRDHTQFVLAEVPDRNGGLMLLQAIEDPDLGFLVLPIDPDAGPIARVDLDRAASELGIDPSALVVLGIVTLRADRGAAQGSVNLKAPLLVDTTRMEGSQYVLSGPQYALQAPLRLA